MNLSDLSIKRPVLAVVMSLLLIVLGVMSFLRLTLRELPAIDPPIVSVQVDYPGASAGVVETRITKPLEDALAGIEGINTIDSNSQNDARGSVSSSYASRDIEAAANDVRNAVSRVSDRIPTEATPPGNQQGGSRFRCDYLAESALHHDGSNADVGLRTALSGGSVFQSARRGAGVSGR